MSFMDRLHKIDVIALLSLMNAYYERKVLCKERSLMISTFFVKNQFFVLEILRKKWLDEFPKLELVLDRLEKRDPTFFPPENIHFNFLYYHLLCSKKDRLQEMDKIGPNINYDVVELEVLGKNTTIYFQNLLSGEK